MAGVAIDYEKDFYAWAMHNADLIRHRRFAEMDVENIAEELEDMGKSEEHQLENRFKILIAHLLKWKFQQQIRSNSWHATIKEQRISIARLLKRNPSLKSKLLDIFENAYPLGVLFAVRETNIPEESFPENCPFKIDQVLDNEYWPD